MLLCAQHDELHQGDKIGHIAVYDKKRCFIHLGQFNYDVPSILAGIYGSFCDFLLSAQNGFVLGGIKKMVNASSQGVNANSFVDYGVYAVLGGSQAVSGINHPDCYCIVFTLAYSATYKAQIAFHETAKKIGLRTQWGGTWSEWKYVSLS